MDTPSTKTNIWVTMENLTNQDSICLSLSTPGNPFSTCLVGLPTDFWPCPSSTPTCNSSDLNTTVDGWDQWAPYLPKANQKPQELDLLGSVKMDVCVYFNHSSRTQTGVNHTTVVNSSLPMYRNGFFWCKYESTNTSISSNNLIQLPQGYFLICGDRAWPGIPSRLRGGPCSIGRLTLLTPNMSMILNMSRHHRRDKRMTHTFTKECKDNVEFWSPEAIVAASFLAPGVASAGAHATLRKLGCWLAKQTNVTSLALAKLLLDFDSVRHSTLQNRAAIDFLLLAQGHGCEEIEGMCCMNFSDRSKSIHAQIQKLYELTGHLQRQEGLGLEGWLHLLGITGWLKSFIMMLVGPVIIILLCLLFGPCLLQCIMNRLQQMTDALFEKRGGDVGGRSWAVGQVYSKL
ncbi:syncytin-2-like [Serinus canaria]|uniref:syncytin-2-like n=1 Tax=Serinus canaria TaxID=9135 RepID=UPI0021CC655A|nr:syncytin-2-like [Serinus canaria]XP_050842370.1 syncytin-2-like [Serinus canaria]